MKNYKIYKKIIALCVSMLLLLGSVSSVYASTENVRKENDENARIKVMQQYSETPYGSSADYSVLVSSVNSSTALSNKLLGLSVGMLADILLPMLGLSSVAQKVASVIIGGAADYATGDTLYYHQEVWGHSSDSWTYRQQITTYYYDPNHTAYAGSATVYIHQYFY